MTSQSISDFQHIRSLGDKEMPSIGPIAALICDDNPALYWLFDAVARQVAVNAFWGWRPIDVFRRPQRLRCTGQLRVRRLPLMPGETGWSGALHRPLIQMLGGDSPVMAVGSIWHLPLLKSFRHATRLYVATDELVPDRHGIERAVTQNVDGIVAVSEGLADAIQSRYGFPAERIHVSPNALPAAWIPLEPPEGPAALPAAWPISRPVAGVLGRISGRLRLRWLLECVNATPWLSWVLVGDVEPAEMSEADWQLIGELQSCANCHFVGARLYHELPEFAASFDVAIMPYSDRSTNPNGSPMRLFLHLAFGAPVLATPGCKQVEEFVPLVEICDSPQSLIEKLQALRTSGFRDRMWEGRWAAARDNSFDRRASEFLAFVSRLTSQQASA